MGGWYEFNDSSTVVIFVHGLFSDSKKCWTSKCGVFWPDLLLKDVRFNRPSVFLAEFYTTPGSNDYGIRDCADEVFQLLFREDPERKKPPAHKDNIVFVAHSTGGIVARYLVEAYKDKFIGKKIGFCLYASPSYGSKWSSFFGAIARLFNNKLAQELNWGSPILKDLDARFLKLLSTSSLCISGIEAYENRAPFGLPFFNTRVVEENSAKRYFGNGVLIPGSDHASIVKPTTIDSRSHQVLLDFVVSENLLGTQDVPSIVGNPSLFDRYKPEFENFYVEREADDQLKGLLSNYSLWVWGVSGVGKTASISRINFQKNIKFHYVSLGCCVGDSVPDLLKEIYAALIDDVERDLCDLSTNECIKLIAEVIECSTDTPFYLFIEEIPIKDDAMFIEFSNYIYKIITRIKHRSDFRFILSSIIEPNTNPYPELQKITERLKVVEWNTWLERDIEKLINVVTEDTGIELHDDVQISSFSGIPRNVKNHFRDQLSKLYKRV